MKSERSTRNIQRYLCQQQDCSTQTFMQEYRYKTYEPGIKEKIVGMAINSSGIRDKEY
jgi:transposase-like protein